jgi:hypothetical protein
LSVRPPTPADALRDAVRRCDDAAAIAAIDALGKSFGRLRSRGAIQLAHDALLFAIAHPTGEATRLRAEASLESLAGTIAAKATASPAFDARLTNSGLPGTLIEASLSHPLVSWLADTYPARIAWAGADADHELTQLFMRVALLPGESERLEREHHPLDRWLARSGAAAKNRRLRAVLNGMTAATADARMQEYLFASLKPFVRWRLSAPSPSLATARSVPRAPFVQRDWVRDVSLAERVGQPLPKPAALTVAEKRQLIGSARIVLGTLLRETDPVTYADERAVTLFRLDRGIDVVLFGMQPRWRLALETYFGYLAFKNGVPAAYGGAWVFGHRCKIGVNVFPFMRGGESALLFAELMRVYGGHFGPEVFFVEPYQIGRGNPDGIRSGAFWFYYRLGFRPVQHELAALAETESTRIARQRGYRSPAAILRRLAEADLRWTRRHASALPIPDPYAVNRALTAFVARTFGGDRVAAVAATETPARKILSGRETPARVQRVARAFGPLIAMLGGVDRWPTARRHALAFLLAEKLEGDEAAYACRLLGHRTYLEALARAAHGSPHG